jgi:hypothetical protein
MHRYSKADSLADVLGQKRVEGLVKDTSGHKVPRMGTVVKIRPNDPIRWAKRREGFVTIAWDECEMSPVETEERKYRFFKKPFEQALAKYMNVTGLKVIAGPIKKLYRLIEKILRHGNDVGCAAVMDILRASFVCDSNEVIAKVLVMLARDDSFKICKVKEGYSRHKNGEWLDVKLIVSLQPNVNGQKQAWHERAHKCELQIYHKDMDEARNDFGGHDTYNKCRSLGEAIKMLEVDDAEMKELKDRILAVMMKGNASQIAELGRMFALNGCLSTAAAHSRRRFEIAAAGDNLSFLEEYPDLPLEDYVNEGNFWHINKDFPLLRCVSKDPYVFLVPNLLTEDRCKALMMKAGPHMNQSKSYSKKSDGEWDYVVNPKRTSYDVYIPRDEMTNTQAIFSEVLAMPVANMEPPKLIRYKSGDHFKLHDDAAPPTFEVECCKVPYANRVVTLFVYLNTPKSGSGGETHFPNIDLKIKPHAGMGVIHFPTYMNTSKVGMKAARGGPGYALDEALKVGMKVAMKPPQQPFIGTVMEVGSKTVSVKFDNRAAWPEIAQLPTAMAPKMVGPLANMYGVADGRVAHEGRPVCEGDEKLILSQWCWPGPFKTERDDLTMIPCNDGVDL